MMRRLALYFYKKWGHLLQGAGTAEKVRRRLERLDPSGEAEGRWQNFWVETTAAVLRIAVVGLVLALAAALYYYGGPEEVSRISRNAYGQGAQNFWLTARRSSGLTTVHRLEVQERLYTDAEVESLYHRLVEELDNTIKKEVVYGNQEEEMTLLPTEVEGYPFVLVWSSDRPEILDAVGKFGESEPDQGVAVVTLTMTARYLEFERTTCWQVRVYPPRRSQEEIWDRQVNSALAKMETDSAYEDVVSLPEEVAGQPVSWSIERRNPVPAVFALTVAAGLFSLWRSQRRLQEQAQKRDRVLAEEYSTVVTRLTLYLGAGMTAKAAFQRTAAGDWKKGGYAGEEMRLACRELDSGVYESVCYERFGWRCGRQEYIKLGALLAQNIKKGNSALLQSLQLEVRDAGEQQKHLVRRRGEEASTRLLGPMLLLLVMILVVIMVPAFQIMG